MSVYKDQNAKTEALIEIIANAQGHSSKYVTDFGDQLETWLNTHVAPPEPTERDAEPGALHFTDSDMFVAVVLPKSTALILADPEPVDTAVMDTFSRRDLAVMESLLNSAQLEVAKARQRQTEQAVARAYGGTATGSFVSSGGRGVATGGFVTSGGVGGAVIGSAGGGHLG